MSHEIYLTDWNTDREKLSQIRRQVFIQEQGVPESMEWDDDDIHSYHILAVDERQAPIGCGRLKPDGQIGRLAVAKHWRNKGIGRQLLTMLLEHTRKQGIKYVYLHAQLDALGFYKKFGFIESSDTYLEAGIPHRTMSLNQR